MTIAISQLNHFGLLRVQGPDAAKFLQGQITCDINEASEDSILYGAHCNHKGRMITNFALLKTAEDSYTLKVRRDLLSTLKASFDKYIVFSKAETEDLSDSYGIFGLQGEGAEQQAKEKSPQGWLPTQSQQRFELWLPSDSAEAGEMTNTATDAALKQWQQEDINAGIGWVCAATSELFLPQMLNLDLPAIQGISFKKGCYTGQEIVARMHYKGQTKRRLQHLQINQAITASPGDELYSDSGKQSIGNIVDICQTSSATDLLAVVTLDNADSETIYLDQEAQLKLSTCALPYAITTDQ
jgi:folate-binding protein YgfZ